MKQPIRIVIIAITIGICSLSSIARAQGPIDRAALRVAVPAQVAIATAAPVAAIVHDQSNGNQTFAPQEWTVSSNSRTGARATFATDQVFTNVDDRSYKRNASLTLAKVSGSASWRVTVPNDTTDYGNGNEVAAVTAECRRAGKARFALTVTMIEEDVDGLAAGDYELTITGTVTPN